jgi:energy-coupling factor transporter ATP-binding protein EcfA2
LAAWLLARREAIWADTMGEVWAARRRSIVATVAANAASFLITAAAFVYLVAASRDAASIGPFVTAPLALIGIRDCAQTFLTNYSFIRRDLAFLPTALRLRSVGQDDPRMSTSPSSWVLAPAPAGLVFDGVSLTYPGTDVVVLDNLSMCWRIEAGETLALVGVNGCDKTTLLTLAERPAEPVPPGLAAVSDLNGAIGPGDGQLLSFGARVEVRPQESMTPTQGPRCDHVSKWVDGDADVAGRRGEPPVENLTCAVEVIRPHAVEGLLRVGALAAEPFRLEPDSEASSDFRGSLRRRLRERDDAVVAVGAVSVAHDGNGSEDREKFLGEIAVASWDLAVPKAHVGLKGVAGGQSGLQRLTQAQELFVELAIGTPRVDPRLDVEVDAVKRQRADRRTHPSLDDHGRVVQPGGIPAECADTQPAVLRVADDSLQRLELRRSLIDSAADVHEHLVNVLLVRERDEFVGVGSAPDPHRAATHVVRPKGCWPKVSARPAPGRRLI